MLTWIVLWVQLRSATLLGELKAATGSKVWAWPAVFRASLRAQNRAHPRQMITSSQFSPRGFGGPFRSARALFVRAGQSLAIQDRLGAGTLWEVASTVSVYRPAHPAQREFCLFRRNLPDL